MKKVILLVIGCLAYVSVQAQSVASPAQVKKVIDTQLATITSKANFSETQKVYLKEYVAYVVKSKTRGYKKQADAMNLKEVDMNTFFSLEQNKVIKEELLSMPDNMLSTYGQIAPQRNSIVEENPKTGF